MAPQMTPTSAALAPVIPLSHVVSVLSSQAHGVPTTQMMMVPTIRDVRMGMMRIDFRDCIDFGRLIFLSCDAMTPERMPAMMPPMKPEPTLTASWPQMRPGAMPGRSAYDSAMNAERTGTMSPRPTPPILLRTSMTTLLACTEPAVVTEFIDSIVAIA